MTDRRPEAEPVDLEAAMLDPTTVFDDPDDVLANAVLTPAQKATVLERWRLEADRIAADDGVRADAQDEARLHSARATAALGRLGDGTAPPP